MGIDHSAFHAQLRDACVRLQAIEPQGNAHELRGQLLRVARLLFEPPFDSIVSKVAPLLFLATGDVGTRIWSAFFASNEAGLAHGILEGLNALKVASPQVEVLAQAQEHATRLAQQVAQSSSDCDFVKHASEMSRLVGKLADDASGDVGGIKRSVAAFQAKVSETLALSSAWPKVASGFDISAPLHSLRSHLVSTTAALSQDGVPTELPLDESELAGLVLPVLVLADEVLRDLATAPMVHQVMLRLCVFLETFDRERLVGEMRKKGTAKKVKAPRGKRIFQNEAALQRAVDSFLFSEGLFPLTHIHVSGGAVDTFFIEKLNPGLSETNRLGTPPGLIELKQTVNFRSIQPARRKTQLLKAIKEARLQATTYRRHLDAQWASHRVYVVVAYNGETRYHLTTDKDEVLLVYLGDTPASGKKEGIELGGSEVSQKRSRRRVRTRF